MAKSNISREEAMVVVDRVASELGLLKDETNAFVKVTGPTNKHRIYVHKSAKLGRIDCTLDVLGQPGTEKLGSPNGSIKCHLEPDLEVLERFLRMLGDGTLTIQVPNKPRPFAATKSREPRATAPPIEMDLPVLPVEYIAEGGTMEERLEKLKSRVREAKIRLLMENRGLSRDEASEIHDSPQREEEVQAARAYARTQRDELVVETGLEFDND